MVYARMVGGTYEKRGLISLFLFCKVSVHDDFLKKHLEVGKHLALQKSQLNFLIRLWFSFVVDRLFKFVEKALRPSLKELHHQGVLEQRLGLPLAPD